MAAVGALYAYKAADRQADISDRLLGIEQERDHARLQVLPNLYGSPGPVARDRRANIAITVVNIGSAVGGPVSVSLAKDDGKDMSIMGGDPVFIEPGERVTITMQVDGDPFVPLRMDDNRRGYSDFPAVLGDKRGWEPLVLNNGYFIRAWDPITEQSWWYPEPPSKEPPNPPFIT